MKSSNPILRDSVFEQTRSLTEVPMSVSGTVMKLLILSFFMMLSAGAVYYRFSVMQLDVVNMLMWAGLIVGFILSLIISFKPKTSTYLAPVYAFAEGALLSAISCYAEVQFPGIVIQAVSITMITVFSMALLYKSGIIKATEKFRAVILTATLAIGVFYLISMGLMFFRVNIPYFSSNSSLSIAINVAIAIIAALNLIIDFDNIEKAASALLPKYFEWYCAFGLLVTIVWLYIEILRILSKLRSR